MTGARLLDGKALAAEVRATLKDEIAAATAGGRRPPGLAVVLVGNDPASAVYVRNKRKACQEVGILAADHDLPEDTSQADLLALIERLNDDPAIDGILVQLPLPGHVDSARVLNLIRPDKDADGFHPVNAGKLFLGETDGMAPCTPLGIMALIDKAGVDLKGKRAVVVGRSNIVGKPMAMMLLARHATVTVCHSRTVDLPGVVREGDVVVAAVGRGEMVRGDWIKPGAVVIDVGMNRNAEGKLVGDVAFAEASQHAAAITPVPGGVGPMTIAMLLRNTFEAYRRHTGA
ncbi:MAG: bifunctional methylenetetrahydrofolate dehydrogenase/methenyltetrahydrofolate cyclohydrolase FolD [Candidatus Sericytochromatia bacterium]|nr:bifunctional methylenetetrahydrofolate dehydrogenase/methenyltetrahydrofolate cyclohydrolase FolD [Candidatus Tanganyikabacteria bacterium]